MSGNQSRIELLIDILEVNDQRALALANLTPPDLVSAVLQEFRELDYLGTTPDAYRLLKLDDQSELDPERPLVAQLSDQDHLVLVENVLPLPAEGQRPSKPIYLREYPAGNVYKLHWYPAIIGRPDRSQANNDLVAIDLSSYTMGLRVSRRHAQIIEEDGEFYIEGLSSNPTSITDIHGKQTQLGSTRHKLHYGDIITLEQSQIALKVIIRQ